MNSADRFIALLVTLITGIGIIMGGIMWSLRALWAVRGAWDRTNSELKRLVDKIQDGHERDNRMEARLERHLEWHDKH